MKKNSSRGCVSIKGTTHELLREKAGKDGVSMSAAMDGEINAWLDKHSPRKPLVLVSDNLKINKLVTRGQQ